MSQSCPNCGIPCTGCAGARIVKASDGHTVCTKCLASYEFSIKGKQPPANTQIGSWPINGITINSISHTIG